MDNYHLQKVDDQWKLLKEGDRRAALKGISKKQILHTAHAFLGDKVASLKIHGENGEIQEERTYPRSGDLRKSKG